AARGAGRALAAEPRRRAGGGVVSGDLLERATRALRDTTGSDPAALDRVLERLDRQKRASGLSMRHVRIVAWTLAGSLLGVGAWANVTGRVRWFAPDPPSAPAPAAAAPEAPSPPRERPRRRGLPPEPSEPEPSPEPELPDPEPSQPEPPERRRTAAAAPRAPAVPPAAVPPVDADALYRAAHEAHFARARFAEALALWDRYLAAAEP